MIWGLINLEWDCSWPVVGGQCCWLEHSWAQGQDGDRCLGEPPTSSRLLLSPDCPLFPPEPALVASQWAWAKGTGGDNTVWK